MPSEDVLCHAAAADIPLLDVQLKSAQQARTIPRMRTEVHVEMSYGEDRGYEE